MRNPSPEFYDALAAAGQDGLITPMFLFIAAKNRTTGADYPVGLWTGDDDITVSVTDGQTGEATSRTYYGLGMSLHIPTIPRVSDLSIQTLQVTMSQLNPIILAMVRGASVRFAKADIHEGIISPSTGTLVSAPEIAFLGEVDGDPIETPAAGGEGSITLEIVSDAIRGLTRVNPARASHNYQVQNRDGDQFARYSTLTENMEAIWGDLPPNKGENKKSEEKREVQRKW